MATHIKDLVDKFLAQKREECGDGERIRQIADRFLDSGTREGISFKGVVKSKAVFKSASSSVGYHFKLKQDKILAGIQEEFPRIKGVKIEI